VQLKPPVTCLSPTSALNIASLSRYFVVLSSRRFSPRTACGNLLHFVAQKCAIPIHRPNPLMSVMTALRSSYDCPFEVVMTALRNKNRPSKLSTTLPPHHGRNHDFSSSTRSRTALFPYYLAHRRAIVARLISGYFVTRVIIPFPHIAL